MVYCLQIVGSDKGFAWDMFEDWNSRNSKFSSCQVIGSLRYDIQGMHGRTIYSGTTSCLGLFFQTAVEHPVYVAIGIVHSIIPS